MAKGQQKTNASNKPKLSVKDKKDKKKAKTAEKNAGNVLVAKKKKD